MLKTFDNFKKVEEETETPITEANEMDDKTLADKIKEHGKSWLSWDNSTFAEMRNADKNKNELTITVSISGDENSVEKAVESFKAKYDGKKEKIANVTFEFSVE